MRLTTNICVKKGCNNITRAGFRFCMQKNCGKKKGEEEGMMRDCLECGLPSNMKQMRGRDHNFCSEECEAKGLEAESKGVDLKIQQGNREEYGRLHRNNEEE